MVLAQLAIYGIRLSKDDANLRNTFVREETMLNSMAEIYPTLEKLSELDNPPSEGEIFLLDRLQHTLPEGFEIYYKPIFNGEVIDIVILRKSCGVVLIKVKDWNLEEVTLDEQGRWLDATSGTPLVAPDLQVNGYRWNMFNLHISGLAEKAAMNENFHKVIHSFVFFFQSKKKDVNTLFEPIEAPLRIEKLKFNTLRKNENISNDLYQEAMDKLDIRTQNISYSKNLLITEENLNKIEKSLQRHILFADGIYNAFREYLRPKYHKQTDGTLTKFVGKQLRLVESKPGLKKIKGVAGSGKTTMLAARAVNAHLRHKGRVLILTFNKTLRNLINQKIHGVPKDFDAGAIDVSNYHSFINMNLGHYGLVTSMPSLETDMESYFERIYANEDMFSGFEQEIFQYDSIFIDEIQDYQPEWIKIIRRYFLKKLGEMVLYGDEGQNIYGRDLKGPGRSAIVQGFGSWEILTRSHRSADGSPLAPLVKSFQKSYLLSKYDIDLIETEANPNAGFDLTFEPVKASVYHGDNPSTDPIIKSISVLLAKGKKQGDITVLCSNIEFLRKCERDLLNKMPIETITTFESEDDYKKLSARHDKNHLTRQIKKIRGSKKFSFDQSSLSLKMSTVHSYKGMESDTVVFIVMPEDNEEIIYTGITRSKKDLFLHISDKSRFFVFFKDCEDAALIELNAP